MKHPQIVRAKWGWEPRLDGRIVDVQDVSDVQDLAFAKESGQGKYHWSSDERKSQGTGEDEVCREPPTRDRWGIIPLAFWLLQHPPNWVKQIGLQNRDLVYSKPSKNVHHVKDQ